MIVGMNRGQMMWVDPDSVAAVVGQAVVTYTPETYTVYLKNGVVFTIELDSESVDLLASLEGARKD